MKLFLVDDEPTARERLRQLLASHEDCEIVGEADDGPSAIEHIEALKPEVVFLDIQMPGCTGMEVAASLSTPRPKIVFCTAYDQYAVDAFELHAVDYLLKPVNRARLSEALDRLRAANREAELDQTIQATGTHPARFLAKRGAKFFVVLASDVVFFASEGGQTRLQTIEGHYWMSPTLAELEERLDPKRFFRVSRGALVELNQVKEIRPGSGGQGEIVMADGTELEVSRRRFKPLLERLSAS